MSLFSISLEVTNQANSTALGVELYLPKPKTQYFAIHLLYIF